MNRFLAGDEEAFDVLYDRHVPAMYQFALRLLGGVEQDAEDVVQEAWLRAADALAGFRWRSGLRTWLLGITLNCAREALRTRARAHKDADVLARAASSAPPHVSDPDLERAIAGLPDVFRVVLVLHDIEGYTHGEIAQRLDIEEATSRSRLYRARRRVRAALTRPAGGILNDP